MSRVYVVQEQLKHNLAPALKYGEIVTLLPPGDANFSVDDTIDELWRGLMDFNARVDWLLLTGDPIAIGLATHIVARKGYGVRFLKWDRQERCYLPIECRIE